MTDVNDIYRSEFLRAAQLKGQARRATIEASSVEVLGQGEKAQQKIVLKLAKVKQRLALNKTNALACSSAWGPRTEHWIDRQIELRPEKVLFSGSMVDTIRVVPMSDAPKPPPGLAAPTKPVPPPAELGDAAEPDEWSEEFVDDIPWNDAK